MYIPTMFDLREMVRGYFDHGSHSLLRQLINHVVREAQDGKTECNFYTAGEHLTEKEEDALRDSGWIINWNSPCLWYEIAWD